jgi:hypothetical protein
VETVTHRSRNSMYICLGEKLGLYWGSQKSAPPSLLVSFDAWYEKLMFVFIENVSFDYHNNHDLCPFAVSLTLSLSLCVYSLRIPFLLCFSSWFLKLCFSTAYHDLLVLRFQYFCFTHLLFWCVPRVYSRFRHSS